MDRLSIHKVKGVKEAIQAAGASLPYLPSYSPDLNLIEQARRPPASRPVFRL